MKLNYYAVGVNGIEIIIDSALSPLGLLQYWDSHYRGNWILLSDVNEVTYWVKYDHITFIRRVEDI